MTDLEEFTDLVGAETAPTLTVDHWISTAAVPAYKTYYIQSSSKYWGHIVLKCMPTSEGLYSVVEPKDE